MVSFGTGKTFRYVGAHKIASNRGWRKAAAFPLFHNLTGCDTISSFTGRGKNVLGRVENVLVTDRIISAEPAQLQLAEMK